MPHGAVFAMLLGLGRKLFEDLLPRHLPGVVFKRIIRRLFINEYFTGQGKVLILKKARRQNVIITFEQVIEEVRTARRAKTAFSPVG